MAKLTEEDLKHFIEEVEYFGKLDEAQEYAKIENTCYYIDHDATESEVKAEIIGIISSIKKGIEGARLDIHHLEDMLEQLGE